MASYDSTGVKITGLNSITKALRNVGVPNKEITDAAKKSADKVINQARTLAPVKSGKLRDSIRIAARATGRISISAGNNNKVPYANPIHWGWFKRNIKPQPFFIKAIGLTRTDVYQAYLGELENLIQRETEKANAGKDD